MNTELFIARRLVFDKEGRKRVSLRIVNIAIIGIALGLAVMILATAIVTGFQKEIQNKVVGFGNHIQIVNFDGNTSYETIPISLNQPFYSTLSQMEGIHHVQVFAMKPGIVKTGKEIQGVVVKGIGTDFDWSFFKNNLIAGDTIKLEKGRNLIRF